MAVRNSLLERFSGKFRRCWKMIPRFSGSAKCYPCQGLGTFRQGKRLLENSPRLRERCWIFSSETATAFLSSPELGSQFLNLVGNLEGIFRGFVLTHRTKAQKFQGKFRSIFRKKFVARKKSFVQNSLCRRATRDNLGEGKCESNIAARQWGVQFLPRGIKMPRRTLWEGGFRGFLR